MRFLKENGKYFLKRGEETNKKKIGEDVNNDGYRLDRPFLKCQNSSHYNVRIKKKAGGHPVDKNDVVSIVQQKAE